MVTRGSRKFRFQLDDGTTIDGVQIKRTRHEYVVLAASEVVDEDSSVSIGQVLIERSRVVYRQVLA